MNLKLNDTTITNKAENSFSFDNVHITPQHQIGLHTQSTWELSYIIFGEGTRCIGDHSEPFCKGEIILIPPGIPHGWFFDSDKTDCDGKIANITLTFGNELLEKCCDLFPELKTVLHQMQAKHEAVKFNNEISTALITCLKNMIHESNAERIPTLLRILLLINKQQPVQHFGKYRRKDKEAERLNQIRSFIICNLRRTISLDDAARHLGMNRVSFCIYFKKKTGKTFVNYYNEFRIEQACLFMQEKDMSIADICYQTGFSNIPYFNRLFKRITGVTPGEYRKKVTSAL